MPKYALKDHDRIISRNRTYVLRVKDLDEGDKPREKMIRRGVNELSSAELLSIILNTGSKKEGVLALSHRLLQEYGSSGIISQTSPEKLAKESKMPLVKACQVVACFELGRRFFQKKPYGSVTIRSSQQAFTHLKDMSDLKKEHFRGLYLNSHYQLVHDEVISVGSLTSSLIHPREVFRPALEYGAVALIIAHNHPSGQLKPSAADHEVTQQLLQAGEVLGIDVLDHLLIAKNKFISLI